MNARMKAIVREHAHRIVALMSRGKPFTFMGIRFTPSRPSESRK
jgi:hypothetical protein